MNDARIVPSRVVVLLALIALLAGCGLFAGTGHWADRAAHVVDGKWIGEELPCLADVWCTAEIAFVESDLGIHSEDVVDGATAAPLWDWVAADGQKNPVVFAGLAHIAFVVLTLRDGSRRATGVYCHFDSADPTRPTDCGRLGDDVWRVGGPGNGSPP